MYIAIIDDSCEDIKHLSLQIKKFFSEEYLNIPVWIKRFQNEHDFLNQYSRHDYEIIFIDYYLDNLTGLELAKRIRSMDSSPALIFTTISRDFAIDSYKVKASGYLIKPVAYEDFKEIMLLLNCKKMRENQFIEVMCGMGRVKILLKDIIYCDVSGHYTQIHTTKSEIIKCRQSFSDFEKQLAKYSEFLSCYRGCMINMLKIEKVNELSFLMSNGEQIPFRTKQKAEILNHYTSFLFEKNRAGGL